MAINTMDAKVKPDCGELLQKAREAQKLKLPEVAAQLKLPMARLVEIETSEFDPSISATFYRGYIRSYARLLKLDPQPLLDSFNQTVIEETGIETNPRLSAFNSKREVTTGNQFFKWVSVLIVIVILGAVGWGLKERLSETSSEAALLDGLTTESEASAKDSNSVNTLDLELGSNDDTASSTASNARSVLTDSSDVLNSTSDINPSANEQAAAQTEGLHQVESSEQVNERSAGTPQSVSSSPTNEALDELVLAFVGDCWVEVSDATGERLAFGIKKNGKVMTLQGLPPFKVLLGDPSVVSLQHNQQAIDLSGYRAGRTVNLVID